MTVPDRQHRTPLFDAMVALAESRKVSFHTPGHKSGKGISTRFRKYVGPKIFSIDLTTLDEVDSLQRPVGVIKEAQELAAEAAGADRSFFLVNGTTGGNHAMILATARPGDEILVPRNVHKSILTGIILSGARPRFFLPEYDPELGIALNVTPEAVQKALAAHPAARLLTLTSPNYYGVAAQTGPIIDAAHAQGRVVLMDEAHGPHLHFHPALPPSAVDDGADLCVQSTHKIVGGMTQASMLHIKGDRVDPARVAGALQILQSTSPSYILMASLDLARMQMATEGRKLLVKAIALAEEARRRINAIEGLFCLDAKRVEASGEFRLDVTKLTVSVVGIGLTGFEASALLNTEFDIQVEMADLRNVLIIVSIGDHRDDLDRLVTAFERLAARERRPALEKRVPPPPLESRQNLTPREAYFSPFEVRPLREAVGRTSADTVTIYPPGIPVLVPGEEVTPEAIEYLTFLAAQGGRLDGVVELDEPFIRLVAC
jgi:arginine/lysine/ornithine decarboxylase